MYIFFNSDEKMELMPGISADGISIMSQTAVDSDTEVRKLLPPPGLYRTKEKLVLYKVRS